MDWTLLAGPRGRQPNLRLRTLLTVRPHEAIRVIMIISVHKDCGQPAVEIPHDFQPRRRPPYRLTCLSCLKEIEGVPDLMALEQRSQVKECLK